MTSSPGLSVPASDVAVSDSSSLYEDTQPLIIDEGQEGPSSMETQCGEAVVGEDCFEDDAQAEKTMIETADWVEKAQTKVDELPPRIRALLDRRLGRGATPAAVLDALNEREDDDDGEPPKKRAKLEAADPSTAARNENAGDDAIGNPGAPPKHRKVELSYGVCLEDGSEIPIQYRDGREVKWNGIRVSRGRFGINVSRKDLHALKVFLSKSCENYY